MKANVRAWKMKVKQTICVFTPAKRDFYVRATTLFWWESWILLAALHCYDSSIDALFIQKETLPQIKGRQAIYGYLHLHPTPCRVLVRPELGPFLQEAKILDNVWCRCLDSCLLEMALILRLSTSQLRSKYCCLLRYHVFLLYAK